MTNTPTNPVPADTDNEPTAAEMDAFNRFAEADIPSNVSIVGDPLARVSEPTMAALSPEDQQTVRERARSSDPDAISRALYGFLQEKRRETLIKIGAGEGATETQRTMLEQANTVRLLKQSIDRIEERLAEIAGHGTVTDEDGTTRAVPIYSVQGDQRTAHEAEKERLLYQMALIAGVQGDRELREANRKDALKARETQAQLAEHREIARRARQVASEDRINRAAEQRAKFLKSNLG